MYFDRREAEELAEEHFDEPVGDHIADYVAHLEFENERLKSEVRRLEAMRRHPSSGSTAFRGRPWPNPWPEVA